MCITLSSFSGQWLVSWPRNWYIVVYIYTGLLQSCHGLCIDCVFEHIFSTEHKFFFSILPTRPQKKKKFSHGWLPSSARLVAVLRRYGNSWKRIAKLTRAWKNVIILCGTVPIYVHPSFYSSLKVRYPMDFGGVSRDGQVTTELGTGSLRHTVDILTPEDFWTIVDRE